MDDGHSKILLQLQCLSEKELKAFRGVLTKELFGEASEEVKLFDFIVKSSSKGDLKKLDKAAAYRKIHPGEKGFDAKKDKSIRNLQTKLSKALADFLIQTELAEDESLQQKLLAKAYRRRNASALFFKETKERLDALECSPLKGGGYFTELASLQMELYFHPETARFIANSGTFAAVVESLELSFVHALFCLQAEAVARKKVLQEQSDSLFLGKAMEVARERYVQKYPVVRLFLRLLSPVAPGEFEGLKREVFENEACLDGFEKSMAFKVLLNYAIASANRGSNQEAQALHDLYRTGLEKKFLHGIDAMDVLQFTNIALAGAAAGAFEWTSIFIEENKASLKRSVRGDAVALCRAHLFYHQAVQGQNPQGFSQAIVLLNNIKRTSEVIELRARPMHLRALYDSAGLDDFPGMVATLFSLADNFKTYLERERQLSVSKKTAYLHFIHCFKELTKLRAGIESGSDAIGRLQTALEKEEAIVFTRWFKEKLAEWKHPAN
jgi:hypothetical protein